MELHHEGYQSEYHAKEVLAGASVAIPAVALAGTEPDPVFVAIENHKRAYTALSQILTARGNAEHQYLTETGSRHPRVLCGTMTWTYGEKAGQKEAIYAYDHDTIDRMLNQVAEQSRAKHEELDQLTARYNELVGPHEEAEGAAGEAEREAASDLAQTTPTTLAGTVAAIAYIRRRHDAGEEFFDKDDLLVFLGNIETFLLTTATA